MRDTGRRNFSPLNPKRKGRTLGHGCPGKSRLVHCPRMSHDTLRPGIQVLTVRTWGSNAEGRLIYQDLTPSFRARPPKRMVESA
jgi:hypothetical protein